MSEENGNTRSQERGLRRHAAIAIGAVLMLCANAALASDHGDDDDDSDDDRYTATPVVVGQCYAACLDRSQTTALALYRRADRLSDLLISDEYHALTTASQEQLVRLEEDAICALAQDHVRALDGCQASCMDIERARGGHGSSAGRARFRHVFNAERLALQGVGLWSSYSNSSTSGPDFNAGCDRYWGVDQGAAASASRVATIPARVGHRNRFPARAKPRPRQE